MSSKYSGDTSLPPQKWHVKGRSSTAVEVTWGVELQLLRSAVSCCIHCVCVNLWGWSRSRITWQRATSTPCSVRLHLLKTPVENFKNLRFSRQYLPNSAHYKKYPTSWAKDPKRSFVVTGNLRKNTGKLQLFIPSELRSLKAFTTLETQRKRAVPRSQLLQDPLGFHGCTKYRLDLLVTELFSHLLYSPTS